MILGIGTGKLWYWEWIVLILSCRTQSSHSLTTRTHTHNTLFSFQLASYPKPTDKCQVLAQMHPLRVSCWERISVMFMDWQEVFLILYFLGDHLPRPQHKPSELEWTENDAPAVSLRFRSWVGPSTVTEDKMCEPKHTSSWMQPVSFPTAL